MKDDLSKYMPDVGKVLEESRPDRIKERRRKAVEKLVDAGLIDRETPPPAVEARVSAPSPWGEGGASPEIDREDLPSAMMPAEERPVTKAAKPEAARRRWPASWILVLAGTGMLLTVMLVAVLVMVGRMKESVEKASATPSATATAMPSTTTMPSTTAATADAVLNATAMPTATATAMPTATATPSATVMPSATAGPAPSGPRKLPGKLPDPKQEHVDPAPPPSAAPPPSPAMTAAPSTAPSATAPSATPDTAPTSTRWF